MRRLLLIVAVAACGSRPSSASSPLPPLPPSPAGIDRAVLERELAVVFALADRACACGDAACLREVDVDYVEYVKVTTIDDPLTEIETWPPDQDAILNAGLRRVEACMADHDVQSRTDGLVTLRKLELLRDHGCACQDRPCTEVVLGALERWGKRQGPVHESYHQPITTVAQELGSCLYRTRLAGALDELDAIRAGACDCQDEGCTAAHQAALDRWLDVHGEMKTTGEDTEALNQIATEIFACLQDD